MISAKVIHGPSWSFWEHAILGERNETDVAGLDGLTYIESVIDLQISLFDVELC